MDYEPPHFEAADMDKDKWYFMTHTFDELPDRYSVGKLDTGHHSYVSTCELRFLCSLTFAV